MRFRIFFLFVLLVPVVAISQHTVWIRVEKGVVLYLSPLESEWIPISGREKIPTKTYVMTRDSTKSSVFKETYVYQLPPEAYLFVEDIFDRDRVEIVGALTRIEAEQLPADTDRQNEEHEKTIGLTYGKLQTGSVEEGDIPYEIERINAIRWFVTNRKYSTALLSLKRMVTRYPKAYLNQDYTDQLFTLYEWFGLYGFMMEESKILLNIKKSDTYNQTIHKWHDFAQKKLLEKQKE